jgi:group I intron endonuclease
MELTFKYLDLINDTIPSNLKIKTGIYGLEINQKLYIGSANDLYHRLHAHKSALLKKTHVNKKLQNNFNKYCTILFIVLEYCTKENKIDREQLYLDSLKPLLNIRTTAEANYNLKATEETKEKLSKSLMEWRKLTPMTQETKDKIRQSSIGKKMSIEAKEKMSKNSVGRKHSEKTKLFLKVTASNNRKTSLNYNFKGEKNPQSKLKDIQVSEIIIKLKKGIAGTILAKEYDVSTNCISLIKCNKSYKHIER